MPVASSGGGHFCAVPSYPDKNHLTANKMNKQFFDNGNKPYCAPSCEVLSIETEGILCASGNPNVPGGDLFENPDYSYDF